MMTKKDYVLIANALASCKPLKPQNENDCSSWANICTTISFALAAENPRFNTVQFLNACQKTT